MWNCRNALRGTVGGNEKNRDAVMGLVFLKFAGDKFDKRREAIKEQHGDVPAFMEKKSFYLSENVFFLNETSRWGHIVKNANANDIAVIIDTAITAFFGININKEFMPTVANTDNVNSMNYKILRKNRFLFSGMQTGRDECIRIGLFDGDEPIIVSPAYTTFEITSDEILPEYFFMLFKRKKMDRLGWFLSDSSIRSNLDWDRFCDIEIDLPTLQIQQKYVDVYNAMLANQRGYENGLDDLKLVCFSYCEQLKQTLPLVPIGKYIEQVDKRGEVLDEDFVKGITTSKDFIETRADLEGVNLKKYKVVSENCFAYVPDTSRRNGKISLAYNPVDLTYLVSSISLVFRICKTEALLPEYLMLWFLRSEFDRYARFHSWGSAREVFSWEEMKNVKIPIPSIGVQQAMVNIYNAYLVRRELSERLKEQIKDICPILIKGSLEEAEA